MTGKTASVFFDIGDSLIHVRSQLHILYTEVINKVKGTAFSADDVRAAMDVRLEAMPQRFNNHFRYSDPWFEAYISGVLEKIECPQPWDEIFKDLFALFTNADSFYIFPDVMECLEEVRNRGFKTAVVSNWGYRLPELLTHLGLSPYFDIILSSADVEMEKPDPGIFRLALSKTGSDPESTVHIGDNWECDVEGANSTGIHGLLLDRKSKRENVENRLNSLSELIPYMQKNNII